MDIRLSRDTITALGLNAEAVYTCLCALIRLKDSTKLLKLADCDHKNDFLNRPESKQVKSQAGLTGLPNSFAAASCLKTKNLERTMGTEWGLCCVLRVAHNNGNTVSKSHHPGFGEARPISNLRDVNPTRLNLETGESFFFSPKTGIDACHEKNWGCLESCQVSFCPQTVFESKSCVH